MTVHYLAISLAALLGDNVKFHYISPADTLAAFILWSVDPSIKEAYKLLVVIAQLQTACGVVLLCDNTVSPSFQDLGVGIVVLVLVKLFGVSLHEVMKCISGFFRYADEI